MRLVAAMCLSLVALAACSDTPVSPSALHSQAAHFDSLATLAIQSRNPSPTRVTNLEVIANALAHGAQPGVVTMTIGGTPVTVHLVGIQVVDTNAIDGRVYVAGWVDSDADTSISVDVSQGTTGYVVQSVALAIGDSSASTQTFPSQFPFSAQNASGSCTDYPITNHFVSAAWPCHLTRGTVSFTADVQADEGPVPVATLIVSPSVTFGIAQFVGF